MSVEFWKYIDLAASYSDTAASEVIKVKKHLPPSVQFYDYKDWLDQQAGITIHHFSKQIYTTLPCIVFATCDWYERPATILEMEFLRLNSHPKLVFDYTGNFSDREGEHMMENYVEGEFKDNEQIDFRCINNFLENLNYL